MMGKIRFIYFFILIGIFSCQNKSIEKINESIESIRKEYAPDSRTAVFSVKIIPGNPLALVGETNIPEAKDALISKLETADFVFEENIQILPDIANLEEKHAIINVSVANLRGNPRYSAELVTQALLGTPVIILKKNNDWYLVQTPDWYIAWASGSNIHLLDEPEFSEWKKADKLIYLPTYGFSLDSLGEKVSDLVAGNVLGLESENTSTWTIRYPDGRIANIPKEEAQDVGEWFNAIHITESSLIYTAKDLMGVPYLWGGTSTKGVDCSGFTKTVYFRHGLILPRDASQQVHKGKLIDKERDFSKLEVGDLLFFGRKNEDGSERVIHVGLWIGNNSFIHASGDVHISSMDSLAENFDAYNYNRYLRTKRILGSEADLPARFLDTY